MISSCGSVRPGDGFSVDEVVEGLYSGIPSARGGCLYSDDEAFARRLNALR
jgi:hypothetical protein